MSTIKTGQLWLDDPEVKAMRTVERNLSLIKDAYRRMATNRDEHYRKEQQRRVDEWLEETSQCFDKYGAGFGEQRELVSLQN